MNDERSPLRRWLPVLIGLLLIMAGFAVGRRAEGGNAPIGYILALGIIMGGCLLLAIPAAQWISHGAGSLFFPDERLDRPPPLYSRAEALAKMDHFDQAMTAYEQIVQDYPEELKPYIDMIEIAIRHYRDPERANRIFLQGIATLQNQDDRDTLSRMYRGIRSRIGEKKEWQKTRTLHLGD